MKIYRRCEKQRLALAYLGILSVVDDKIIKNQFSPLLSFKNINQHCPLVYEKQMYIILCILQQTVDLAMFNLTWFAGLFESLCNFKIV